MSLFATDEDFERIEEAEEIAGLDGVAGVDPETDARIIGLPLPLLKKMRGDADDYEKLPAKEDLDEAIEALESLQAEIENAL